MIRLSFSKLGAGKTVLRLISSREKSHALAQEILGRCEGASGSDAAVPYIGVDCEGARLGRFGRMSLMQIWLGPKSVVLIDANKPGAIDAFAPVLESEHVRKVMHDSREDSASLYHQFGGIRLQSVVDTQVAGLLLLKARKDHQLRQQGYIDLVNQCLKPDPLLEESHVMKQRMQEDAQLWNKRPLPLDLVEYAVQGVEYLVPLWESLKVELMSATELSEEDMVRSVLSASDAWVGYCGLNPEISQPSQVEKLGTPILGMVASITDRGVFFKLNIGRTGVCSTPSALKRMLKRASGFEPVQVGDVIELAVSGVSSDGRTIYVDRRDCDWEYFDFLRRPDKKKAGTVSGEYRHTPTIQGGDEGIDPLLRRGFVVGGDVDSDSDGEVDHLPVLTKKPVKKGRHTDDD